MRVSSAPLILFVCHLLPHVLSFMLSKQVSRSSPIAMVMPVVPYYPTKGSKDYQWMDIYNALGRDRTLFVGRYLDDETCNQLIASLVWLQGQNSQDPITLYFNVPGGMIKPAFAVYDMMRKLSCPLITVNTGLTVGMGALLCAVGTPGRRCALPNSRFLMAKSGLDDGIQGQSSDIRLAVIEVMKDNDKAIKEFAKLCGQPLDRLQEEFKRDFYLTAAEAAAYGLIDHVLVPKQPVKLMKFRGDDDDTINFGHFCEARPVKEGPNDDMAKYKALDDIDEYAADELQKKGYPEKRDLKGINNRFANSRCKPPGLGNAKKAKVDTPEDLAEKFKNSGF